MNRKVYITVIVIFILFLISIFIPVKEGKEWVHSSPISDVGHYEKCYYNIYGGKITILNYFVK